MLIEALYHQANSEWSFIENDHEITLLFRFSIHDTLNIKVIEYNRFSEYSERKTYDMIEYLKDQFFNYVIVTFHPDNFGCVYYFSIYENNQLLGYYTEYGFTEIEPYRLGAYEIPRIQPTDIYHAIDSNKHTVFYQIFPDRFAKVDQTTTEQLEAWESIQNLQKRYGGNLKGIQSKLPYLSDLGINAIYMTPIALSNTCHRYDTIDYMKIDPLLGSDEDFKEFVNTAHQYNIKVVLDAVFNHCSLDFFAFQDVLKNGENSQYKDWFMIESFPVSIEKKNYQTFAHERHMPKLNSHNQEVREYLLHVIRHYMEAFSIDGWRLDVADEVDSDFWRVFRKEVKKNNPDNIIIGEVWHNSDYYLRGDQFDSVQNYQFYEIINKYFVRNESTLQQFKNEITHLLMMYPRNVQISLLNQFDSHDTPRIRTMLHENDPLLLQVIAFQFMYIGMPCVYYGDEVGLLGSKDPDNRRTFNWNSNTWNQKILDFYKLMIKLKKSESAMGDGNFRFIDRHDGLLEYVRYSDNNEIKVLSNPTNLEISGLAGYALIITKITKGISEIIYTNVGE